MAGREALDYYDHKDGLSVIAVGGNKLSRGLTLEGLSVSYYLRASRMYDTLMQMGRWFGYRGGYVDLCRLFTSRELNEWFCHITQASEELREEFDYMSDIAGSTPEQYALRVRTHPGVLQISATNKMRSAITVQISWAGRLVESYEFKKDISIIDNNLRNTQNFISGLQDNFVPKPNAFVWYDIPAEQVINFFEGIQSVENLKKAEPRKIIQFITTQLRNEELTDWRVALMSKPNAKNNSHFIVSGNTVSIGQWKRTEDIREQIYNKSENVWKISVETLTVAENLYENKINSFGSIFAILLIDFSLVIIVILIINKNIRLNLEIVASKDTLTNIGNRNRYNESMEIYLKLFKNQKKNISYIIFDIDYFKKINDNYGHDFGDEVLRKIAKIILTNIKKDDTFCRIGGEEFVLITDTLATKEDLVKFSNKLRTSVEDFDFDLGYKVTISLGATFFKENDTKDTIFKRTDEALYISKNSGRNIVTIV
jgi:diguanylate cyclase (GGDEF)-like protein